jgi:hypothetical protein
MSDRPPAQMNEPFGTQFDEVIGALAQTDGSRFPAIDYELMAVRGR